MQPHRIGVPDKGNRCRFVRRQFLEDGCLRPGHDARRNDDHKTAGPVRLPPAVDNWLIGHQQNPTRHPCPGEDPQRFIANKVLPFPGVGVLFSKPTNLLPGLLQHTSAHHLSPKCPSVWRRFAPSVNAGAEVML
jgi:hypothetical protein